MKTDVEIANGLKLAPKIVPVCVLDRATPYTDGFPPQSAVELLAWLNNHIASVPTECLPSLVVEFGVTSVRNDDDVSCCSVHYERMETADEFAERAAKQVAAARATLLQQESNERRQLAALKAKYEPNN